MIVLMTMSLSLVYQDLLKMQQPDPAWATRGEELCRESLRLSEEPNTKATAWYNLGGWRRTAGDFQGAAGAFLEAASLYEDLDDQVKFGYSLAFRAHCLLECQELVQARLEAVRAVTLLVKQPTASKDLIRYAYDVGERALSMISTTQGS
jgi:hypothetical protein